MFGNRKYVLMHKDKAVLSAEYSPQTHTFRKITEVHDASHYPVGTFVKGSISLDLLNDWWVWRGIPDYRVDLKRLLKRLGVANRLDLLEEEFGLSLSDHYWLRQERVNASYEELNYFHRPFDQEGFARSMFRQMDFQPQETALRTPGNTLCGFHRKAWIRRDNKLFLLKGSVTRYQEEPFNEWLAWQAAKRLGIYAVPYRVETYENQIVSVCPEMLNLHTDLVPARDAMKTLKIPAGESEIDCFLELLEQHGITDVDDKFDEMLILDFLLLNSDRHNQNFGILVNADTNQWIDLAPIFDTGSAMGCFTGTDELPYEETHEDCKLFSRKHFRHDELGELIMNPGRFDFSVLDDLPEAYERKLASFQEVTRISDHRIEALSNLLRRRISKLKHLQ